MGIKWDKVLEAKKMAELKGKESARVINLEQQVADLTKTVKELQENKIEETSLEEENPKVEGKTYSCEQCGETFDTPLAKARHIRLSHK